MLRITRLYTFIRLYSLMRLTIAGASVCSDETSDLFINEPTDIVVREGDNATLTCSISSYDTEDEHVEWEISPNIYETKESTDETPNIKTSEITVYNVGRTEQHFRCSISFASRSELHETGKCHRSRVASTTVLYFPREDEISCGSNHVTDSNPLRVGDVFQGRCEVSRGKPPVDIGWGTDDGDILIPQLGSLTEEGLMRVSVIKVTLHEEFLNKSLVCIVTSKLAFPDRRLECRITPLSIVQKSPDYTHSDSAGSYSETVTEATSERFHSTFDMFEPTATASGMSHTQSTTVIIGVCGSALLVCILLAIAYILNKYKNKNSSRTCHGQTTGLVQMARQANSATVLVEDHLYEDPDVDQDTTNNLDITHTYFVDTLPSPLSTSPDSCSTYFSEAFSSVYDDEEEEYCQPSTNLREITSCDSPCRSVYQNQHIVDIHSFSGKNARKGRPLYRRPPSDQQRGSHRPAEPEPPELPGRSKPMKGSHLREIGDVPSLVPSLLSGLSCHSPLSPSVSTTLSPVTNPLSSSVPISPSSSSCLSVSSSLPCHSNSPESRSISLPTSPESSPRSQHIFSAFSSLPSIFHKNTSCSKSDLLVKENNLVEETSV